MFNKLAIGGALVSLLAAPMFGVSPEVSRVVTSPPADKIVIDVMTVMGTGCPANTAAVAVSLDNTAFTVTYSQYIALVGVGAKPTDFRKNCQLNLIVHVPGGFTYGISKVDYRGFASLEKGATAIQRANYYFQGSSDTAYKEHAFTGPLVDDWFTTDEVPTASIVYAPCGELRNFNINTELRVAAGTSDPTTTTSFMQMDSTDGSLSTVYHFAWKQCPASTPSPTPAR